MKRSAFIQKRDFDWPNTPISCQDTKRTQLSLVFYKDKISNVSFIAIVVQLQVFQVYRRYM